MSRFDECPYQRVEYIENSPDLGFSHIIIDYVPQGGDIDIELEFMPVSFGSYTYDYYFIAYTDASVQGYLMQATGANKQQVNIRNGNASTTNITSLPIKVGERNFLRMEGSPRRYQLNEIEGDLKAAATKINTDPLLLMGRRSDESNSAFWRLYYFQLWKAGKQILDLVPVRIGDEGFMYDKVSGKLFGNGGTGKFILGPDVL